MRPLSIARLNPKSAALGPGCRAIIWTHGCSRQCPGCIAREMNESPPEGSYSPEMLYQWVKSCSGITGITISGGEPFEQDPEALCTFLKMVREDPRRLSILCYTGCELATLQKKKSARAILECIDVLIDGAYLQERNTGLALRGSDNQRIHVLNKNFQEEYRRLETSYQRKIEIALSRDFKLELTGIPPKDFLQNLAKKLDQHGYIFSMNNHLTGIHPSGVDHERS